MPPTAAMADAFIARANAELAELSLFENRANWVNATNITVDTDWLAANPGATPRQFHDRFLSYGVPPVPLVRRVMLGADGSSFQALALVRFGRFADLLQLTTKPSHPVHDGLWAYGRGLAHLRAGGAAGTDSARAWLARVDSLATHTPSTVTARQHTAARLLGIVGGILRAELLVASGQLADALPVYRSAIELEEGLTYDEPEPLPFKTHEFLGAALLEAGRAAEAVPVYEASLVARPNSGWSLFGLEAALRASGRTADADATKARFTSAWQRSAVKLGSSRY